MILTGLWRRPAMYMVFQCIRSSIRDSVLITPYLIIWEEEERVIVICSSYMYSSVQTKKQNNKMRYYKIQIFSFQVIGECNVYPLLILLICIWKETINVLFNLHSFFMFKYKVGLISDAISWTYIILLTVLIVGWTNTKVTPITKVNSCEKQTQGE